MNLTEQRKLQLVGELESQLELSPSVSKLILKAKPKALDLSTVIPRSTRLGQTPRALPEPPKWAQTVVCPRCGGLLKPLKSKASKQWGESITYQCHNSYQGSMCLLVVEISESMFKMVTEDFTNSDFSWKTVAPECIPVLAEMKPVDPYPFKVAPPSPWIKVTLRSILFQAFWQEYLKNKQVSKEWLYEFISKNAPKYASKSREVIDSIPQWMEAQTGFVLSPSPHKVLGKGKGSPNLEPFSSAKYRQDFGFQ